MDWLDEEVWLVLPIQEGEEDLDPGQWWWGMGDQSVEGTSWQMLEAGGLSKHRRAEEESHSRTGQRIQHVAEQRILQVAKQRARQAQRASPLLCWYTVA